MTLTISPGRARRLQASTSSRGTLSILAIDHREPLRNLIDPSAPERVPTAQLTEFKLETVRHLADGASAVLLDPLYGLAQAITAAALPGNVGLICAIEEEGYSGDASNRRTRLLPNWSVEKAERIGATGVKVLLYYHPDAGAAAQAQEEFVRNLLQDCRRLDMPLFLEPISYSLDPDAAKGSAEFARRRRAIVIESARRLGALGPDVLKVEFPIDARFETDQRVWREACRELNEAAAVPWALLSADESFDTFERQLRVACEEGSSGFLAGRSIWREAASLSGAARADFLQKTARPRFQLLAEIVQETGNPWYSRYAMPEIGDRWYINY